MDDQTTQHLKALNRIARHARIAAHGSATPAMPHLFVGALIGIALGVLVGNVLAEETAPLWLGIAGFGIGIVTGWRMAPFKDWETLIFDELAEYAAHDVEAYKSLQEKAAAKTLGWGDIIDWANIERQGLHPSLPTPARLARERFAAKQS